MRSSSILDEAIFVAAAEAAAAMDDDASPPIIYAHSLKDSSSKTMANDSDMPTLSSDEVFKSHVCVF